MKRKTVNSVQQSREANAIISLNHDSHRPHFTILWLAVIFMVSLTVSPLISFAQVSWDRYNGNPILSGSKVQPDVYYDATTQAYMMWFVNNDSWTISYATSADGLNWTIPVGNPVIHPNHNVSVPRVIRDSSGFRMYYLNGSTNSLTMATSADGVTWSAPDTAVFSGTPSSWDSFGLWNFCVLHSDTSWYLWYTSGNPIAEIGLATSSDGIHWTKNPSNPILVPTGNDWESYYLSGPFVFKQSGMFHMLYLGSYIGGCCDLKMGYATSPDGITWTRSGLNPVFSSDGTAWENSSIANLSAIVMNDTLKMWYTAYGSMGWAIGEAKTAWPFPAPTYDSTIVAHWSFDDAGQAVAVDFSNNHLDGTAYGTTLVAGYHGTARQFNGSSDYVSVADNPAINFSTNKSFTISFWFKTSASGTQEFIRKGVASKAGYLVEMYNGHVRGVIGDDGANSAPHGLVQIMSGNTFNDGIWHSVTFSRDAQDHQLTLSVDGNEAASPINDTYGFDLSNDEPLNIGRWNGMDGVAYLNGFLDDVMISTPTSVTPQDTGTYIAHWKLDDPEGGQIHDDSPNHIDGTATGTTVIAGKFGQGRHFNGSGDHILFPSNVSLGFDTGVSFSISLWFRTASSSGMTMIRKGSAPSSGYGIFLDGGHVKGFIGDDGGASYPHGLWIISSNSTYNDGIWHKVTFRRSQSDRKLYLFVDNIQATSPLQDDYTFPLISDRPLTLGEWEGLGGVEFFSGDLDEISITRDIAAVPPGFTVALTATTSGNNPIPLQFGTHLGATAGLDSALEEELPPMPPEGTFDARWLMPLSNGSLENFQDTLKSDTAANIYRGTVQLGNSGYPVILSWSRSALPTHGSFFLRDAGSHGAAYNIDMQAVEQFQFTDSTAVPFEIVYNGQSSIAVPVAGFWNMVSVPMIVENPASASVFPDASSKPYSFDHTYIVADSISHGTGYWVKFGNPATVVFHGTPTMRDSIAVHPGWNLIGSIGVPVDTSDVVSDPPGLIASRFFVYQNGYIKTQTIQPGSAYWVKAAAEGFLILNSPGSHASRTTGFRGSANDEMNTLTIEDAAKHSQVLRFTASQTVQSDPAPPLPPAGGFDARFAGQQYTASLTGDQTMRGIELTGTTFPVRITWNLPDNSSDYVLVNLATGTEIGRLQGSKGAMLVKTQPSGSLALRAVSANGGNAPARFELLQNYPNPFNPSTRIQYTLPSDAMVSLQVYNVLGQNVATLVNQDMKAGFHAVDWNASSMPSGLYWYRLTTQNFTSVKAMLLAK